VSLGGVVGRHRGAVIVGVVVVGIAAVVSAIVWIGTSGSDRAHSGPDQSAARSSTPGGPAGELVRLASDAASTFDVVYSLSDPRTGPTTAHQWRRGPLGRLDIESGQGDAARRSTQLVSPSGPVACTQAGSAPWSCAPRPGLTLSDVGVVPPDLVAGLSKLGVSVRAERVAGQSARCFTVTDANTTTTGTAIGSAELCLTSDGIPVRLAAGSTRVDAVSLVRARPPDSVFKPPA